MRAATPLDGSDRVSVSFKFPIIPVLAFTLSVLAASNVLAQVSNVQAQYPDSSAGGWSTPANVIGPPDDACSNMGAVGVVNATYTYGYSIPNGATITGFTAHTKTGEQSTQQVNIALARDASSATPMDVGTQRILQIPDVGNGACASTIDAPLGGTPTDWGLPGITPAQVNSSAFGVIFTKINTSSVKIDSICLEVQYTTAQGPATQTGCFTVPFTVFKDFTDNNAAFVDVTLSCSNGATIFANPLQAAEGTPAVFGVEDPSGTATCTAVESGGLPPNYVADESDCQQPGLLADGGSCTIVNTLVVPSMSVTKTVTNMGPFGAGDTINYTIEVTNDGDVTLTNVVVSDPLLGLVNAVCSASLAPMASCQVMGSYMVTQADIDNNGGGDGDIDNTATADSNETEPEQASATAALEAQNASMSVIKSVTNTPPFAAGDTINYTITVTNDGNVTLTNVTVSDPLLGLMDVACSASLAPGANCQVMGSYLVTQGDIDNNGGGDGDIDNTATASSNEAPDEQGSAEADLVAQDPVLTVDKAVTNMGPFGAGDTINYTITVTNDGNVTLTNVTVSDPLLGLMDAACSASLAPGANCQVMGSYLVTQGDIDDNGGGDGDIDNTATATSDQVGPEQGSAAAPLVTQGSSMSVTKTVTNTGPFGAGDTINYTIEVTNDGNTTLTNVTVSDPLLGLMDAVCSASLAPAASCQVMGSYMVTQGDIDTNGGGDGDIDNTATANSDEAGPEQASAEAQLVGEPAMSVTKTVTNMGPFAAGDTINYTIEVTNDGAVTLNNVVVSDPLLGLTDAVCSAALAPAASCQVMGSYLVTQGDIDDNGGGDGDIDNTATADSDEAGPEQASAQAPLVAQDASLAVSKMITNTGPFDVGDTINYTITVTNDGNTTLTNVVVSDPLLGLTDVSCAASLAPGANCQVMGSYMVTQGDIDDNGGGDGDIDNTATANSDQAGPQQASAAAPLVALDPDVTIVKTADPNTYNAAGDVITYTFVVTNTGNVTLFNLLVADPLITDPPNSGTITCQGGNNPIATLAIGASETCAGTYTVTQDDVTAGEISNVASVVGDCGTPGRGESCASDDDDEVVEGETLRTTFLVTKDFSDDNPAGVTVLLECNTGLPLQQMGVVHDPDAVGLAPGDFTTIEFVVNDFLPGTMDCDIEEVIPAGYVPTYTAGATTGIADAFFSDEDGCHYELIEGGQFTCGILNELQPVDVVVEKEWIDENPEFQQSTVVNVTLECDGPIQGGFNCANVDGLEGDLGGFCAEQFIDPNNPGVFEVLPHFEGTTCTATEELLAGVVTDESDCEELVVFPGQGDSCVIVNTRLYAGIPTLNQFGLMLLALMMLGVGAVAFRRFV